MKLSFSFQRCLSIWVAIVCILGQVAGFAHLLLVRHTACETHQTLMEEGEPHQAIESAQTDVRDFAAPQENNHETHNECFVCSQNPKVFLSVIDLPVVHLWMISGFSPRAPTLSNNFTTQTLYLLAPKNSPPLV